MSTLKLFHGHDLWDGVPSVYISDKGHDFDPDDVYIMCTVSVPDDVVVPGDMRDTLLPSEAIFVRLPQLRDMVRDFYRECDRRTGLTT